MIIWLIDESGNARRFTEKWVPSIFIQPKNALADSALSRVLNKEFPSAQASWTEKFVRPEDFERSAIIEIKFSRIQSITNFARWVALNYPLDYELYNVGIPPAQTYLYTRDLFPLAFAKPEQTKTGLRWELQDAYSEIDYELPPFNVVRLRLKTSECGKLRRIHDPITSIQLDTHHDRITIDVGSEADKILKLVQTIRALDPDIVLTRDGDSYVFPALAARAKACGIQDELVLGRDGPPIRMPEDSGKVYFSYGRIFYKPTPTRLYGRLHLDTDTDFLFDDCGEHGLFEVARTCRTPLHRASRETIGTNMTSLQMYVATRNDILIPWKKNNPENFKSARDLLIADRDGLIFEPRVGAFNQIGELDFVSLYPALMMRENLTPECISCKCCTDAYWTVPNLAYRICERKVGIIPKTLQILLQKRADYKRAINSTTDPKRRDLYEKRQAALKWILVTSFGYLGYRNARFGKIDAHIAVCAFSRKILREATHIAETAGFRIVHGIVDSLWLRKRDASNREFYELSRLVESELQLPVSYEGKYKWIVFLPSRTHPHVPVLNRYYGVFEDGKIKTRGIEIRRRDVPNLVKECQRVMIEELSVCSDVEHLKQAIPDVLGIVARYARRVLDHEVAVEDLAFHRQLSKNSGEYLNDTAQAVAAKQLCAAGAAVSAGQVVSYVIVDQKAKNPAKRSKPLELALDEYSYDEMKYVNLLLDSAANLLAPLGWTKDQVSRFLNLSPVDR